MDMFVAPLNTVYATLEKKFYDTITFDSGVQLYRDTSFHPEEYTMLQATVISVPKAIMKRPDYAGMSIDLRPGDTILIRYDVVYSYVKQPDRDTPIYKNVLLYKGNEYWKVDLQKIFGVIRDNRIDMINGYVCCDPLAEDQGDYGVLIRPEHYRMTERDDTMRIKYIGKPLGDQPMLSVQEGDVIHCLPGVAQRYEINLQHFYIIKQSHILGIVEKGAETSNSSLSAHP
jgi:hypothetical protein